VLFNGYKNENKIFQPGCYSMSIIRMKNKIKYSMDIKMEKK
jgi:hypothetical protein